MLCSPRVSPGRLSSPPSLDCPLPSQDGQYELKIEVQPKAHHRAHYETEGSRGAVKATSGGHPVVKVRSQAVTDGMTQGHSEQRQSQGKASNSYVVGIERMDRFLFFHYMSEYSFIKFDAIQSS